MRLKHPPWTEKDINRVNRSSFTVITPLPGQHSTFSHRKWEPKEDNQLPQCCGTVPERSTQVLTDRDHWRILQGSTTGDQIEKGRGTGLTSTSTQLLGDYISASKEAPAQIPAELSWWPQLARVFSWQCCLICPSQQESILGPHKKIHRLI